MPNRPAPNSSLNPIQSVKENARSERVAKEGKGGDAEPKRAEGDRPIGDGGGYDVESRTEEGAPI